MWQSILLEISLTLSYFEHTLFFDKVVSNTFVGQREAAINVAEGKKQSQILASEARKMEQINIATGNQLHLSTDANSKS